MKREELIEYKADENFGNGLVYSIIEVNQVLDEKEVEIASLKAENESLKAKLETVNELVKTSKDMYDRTIESLKASHYAEMVDAGMRERRLRRALYKACANWAKSFKTTAEMLGAYVNAVKWDNMEHKCLKKAGFYL